MASSHQIQQLLEKTKNGDPDVRWMACSDIQTRIQEHNLSLDDSTETQLVDQILSLFNDNNSEVKSQAARVVSILVAKVKEARVQTIIEKLTLMTGNKDEALRDIASLGLRSVVKEIAPESRLAQTACSKLAPKILQQLKSTDSPQDLLIQLIEVLGDVYTRFDATIRANPAAQSDGLAGLTPLLNDSRGAIRKRTIRTLGNLAACSGDKIVSQLVDSDVLPSLTAGSVDQLKTSVALCGALASASPKRTGKKLHVLLPPILKATTSEDDELKEVALQTLEIILLRCPAESTSSVPSIVDAANTLIRYDPNYAGDADDDMDEDANGDEDGMDGEDEDEQEDFEEEYEDDDDVSWKVRRAAVKLLNVAIETRLEMLATFYKSVAPVLISRFSEREETVKLEIWNTYTSLLEQTGTWTGSSNLPHSPQLNGSTHLLSDEGRASRAGSPVSSLKRKRGMDVDSDSPVAALQRQAPSVAKSIIKQLSSSKAVVVRQAGFTLLNSLVLVLQGGLDANIAPLVSVVDLVLKSSQSAAAHGTAGGSTTALKIQIFHFLALIFRTHSFRTLQPHLPRLVTLVTSSINDRSPKVGAAAFIAAAEFVKLCRPIAGNPAVESISSSSVSSTAPVVREVYDATLASLSRNDADQEIRETGIVCLGDLITHAGAEFGGDLTKALQILSDRLLNENTRLVALNTISKIANATSQIITSKATESTVIATFLQESAAEIVTLLRKNNKPLQAAAYVCLEAVLNKAGGSLDSETAETILATLQATISNPDGHLARSFNILSSVLEGGVASTSVVEKNILPSIYTLISSPSTPLTGTALDGLLRFFGAYVAAGADALSVVKQLTSVATQSKGGLQVPMTASRCIGSIYRSAAASNNAAAPKIVDDIAASTKASKAQQPAVCLGLLTLGEIGRRANLEKHKDAFATAVTGLTSSSDEIRSAAAFAIGNMAAGSPTAFLPAVLGEIQSAATDDRKLHLLLGAVKETLSYSNSAALADLSNALWGPLFQICESASAQQNAAATAANATGGASSAKAGDDARLDGTRNLAAECLGKITLTNPASYLGQLQSRLQADSPGTRAAVITAIRFTFTDASTAYDDLLAPLIVQFLSLMKDSDLTVRRLAVSSLTSAAHNKPQLIRDHMSTLQPLLYQETKIDPALIHEVTMGPFKVKVDDGLSIRKAAYQCMYTLLETCLNKLDLNAYLDIVIGGLKDDDDIKVSCYLMLVKLRQVAPTAVAQRLDSAAPSFDAVIKTKLKDTAVKQEIEKLAEMQRSALRTMAALLAVASENACPRFWQLANETKNSALWGAEFKEMILNATESKGSVAGLDNMDID